LPHDHYIDLTLVLRLSKTMQVDICNHDDIVCAVKSRQNASCAEVYVFGEVGAMSSKGESWADIYY